MSKELENVVIICATLTRQLEKKLPVTHRLVLVDSQAFSFYPIAALRAAVVPGWEDKVFAKLEGFYTDDPRHVMLPETRVVKPGDGFVETNRANEALGFSTRIDFDIHCGHRHRLNLRLADAAHCRLAAGWQRELALAPARHQGCATHRPHRGRHSRCRAYGRDHRALSGKEGYDRFSSSERLLSDKWPTKLSDKLAAELRSTGAELIFGQKVAPMQLKQKSGPVTLTDGRVLEANLIFATAGITINPQIVKAAAPSTLNEAGFVKPNEYLRVNSEDGPFATSTYFAIGDVADSPGRILALTSGSQTLAKVPPPLQALVVPLGSKKGQSLLPVVGVLGGWVTSLNKGDSLFIDKFQSLHPSWPSSLDAVSASSNASTTVILPAVGAVAVALALVHFGLLDKSRLGPIAGLF